MRCVARHYLAVWCTAQRWMWQRASLHAVHACLAVYRTAGAVTKDEFIHLVRDLDGLPEHFAPDCDPEEHLHKAKEVLKLLEAKHAKCKVGDVPSVSGSFLSSCKVYILEQKHRAAPYGSNASEAPCLLSCVRLSQAC